MKRWISISLVLVSLTCSLALSLQYGYQKYICTDKTEYLEVAGRQITMCGKVCSLEEMSESMPQKAVPQHKYITEIPPLFLHHQADHRNQPFGKEIIHDTKSYAYYSFVIIDNQDKPPRV